MNSEEKGIELSELQRRVTQQGATESPFSGRLLLNQRQGVYYCLCCQQPLFTSGHKFDSGCGWPSFDRSAAENAIRYLPDNSHGMQRIEARCGHCDAHLGHIFDDGPTETGQRYCINSSALCFVDGQTGEKIVG